MFIYLGVKYTFMYFSWECERESESMFFYKAHACPITHTQYT